jgi:hypothetical protein
MTMAAEQIEVTKAQFDRIEAAWEICAYGSRRIASGKWAKTFDDCVQEVIGHAVPESFSLKVIA